MSQWQINSTLTKENQPNNQQTWYLQNKISLNYEQDSGAIGKEYSKINVVEDLSVTEETLATDSICEAASDNNISASDFQDAICGEPMKQQIIRLDFTPEEGIDDNEEVFKKCHGFWKFLEKHPEMHHLKVVPEKQHTNHNHSEPVLSLSDSEVSIEHHPVRNRANVEEMSAIEWVDRKDIMTNAMTTLEPQRYCEHFNEDYCDMRGIEKREKIITKKRRSRLGSIKPLSTSKVHSTRSSGHMDSVSSSHGRRTSLYNVEELVSQMKAWDLQHTM